jgi:TetR/AcrR family transcriptional regulator
MPRFESEQRAQILEAAARVFAERGWKGATTRLVGRAAGVNSALIYYYFENKDTLFQECIRHVLEGFLEYLRERRHGFRNGFERVQFLVDGVFGYFSAHADRMQLILLAINLHPERFGHAMNTFLKNQALVPLDVLAEGMGRGELRRMNPIQTWWCILGMCTLSLHMHRIMPHIDRALAPAPLPSMNETRKQIAAILESGIAVPEAGRRRIRRKEK